MKSFEKFFLVPKGASVAGLSEWSVRADNLDTPDGRMLLLRVGNPETAATLRAVPGAVELGANLDAPIARADAKVTRALSSASGATVREKISGRFGPEYDPFR